MCLIPDQSEACILTTPGVRRGIPEGGKAPAGKAAPKGAIGTKPPAKAVPNKPAGKHIWALLQPAAGGCLLTGTVSIGVAGHDVLAPKSPA